MSLNLGAPSSFTARLATCARLWSNPSIERRAKGRFAPFGSPLMSNVSYLGTATAFRPFPSTSFDNNFAYLNDWGQVRVVGNVAHDLLSMRSKASLK